MLYSRFSHRSIQIYAAIPEWRTRRLCGELAVGPSQRERKGRMARTFKLPPVEFRIKGRAALAFDEASQSFTLISHFSSKHWVKTFRVTTRTRIPTDVGEALSLKGNREIESLMRTLSSALAPDRVIPRAVVDPPVSILLMDAMPDHFM